MVPRLAVVVTNVAESADGVITVTEGAKNRKHQLNEMRNPFVSVFVGINGNAACLVLRKQPASHSKFR